MTQAEEHDKWCRDQHNYIRSKISKIDTTLGKMDVKIAEHATCAKEVRDELKIISDWTKSRDGGLKALIWVSGISGSLIALVAFIYSVVK